MKTTTILAVMGLAILFVLTIIFEAKSAPTMEEDEGEEYLPPLTKRQEQYQFASKMTFFGILGIIFTILITMLESC